MWAGGWSVPRAGFKNERQMCAFFGIPYSSSSESLTSSSSENDINGGDAPRSESVSSSNDAAAANDNPVADAAVDHNDDVFDDFGQLSLDEPATDVDNNASAVSVGTAVLRSSSSDESDFSAGPIAFRTRSRSRCRLQRKLVQVDHNNAGAPEPSDKPIQQAQSRNRQHKESTTKKKASATAITDEEDLPFTSGVSRGRGRERNARKRQPVQANPRQRSAPKQHTADAKKATQSAGRSHSKAQKTSDTADEVDGAHRGRGGARSKDVPKSAAGAVKKVEKDKALHSTSRAHHKVPNNTKAKPDLAQPRGGVMTRAQKAMMAQAEKK